MKLQKDFGSGILATAGVMLVGMGIVVAEDWPQWRGPKRDGVSAEKVELGDWGKKAPELVWMGEGMGNGYAGVAVVGGRVYTTGDLPGGQGVVAVNAADGKVLWSTVVTEGVPKHGYEGARCTPTVVGERLWVTTSDGVVACLETSGKLVWKKDFAKEWGGKMMSGWGFSESVLIDGDVAVCTPGGVDAMMVALDKDSGEEKWRCKVPEGGKAGKPGAGYGSAVVSQGAGVKQYVQMTGVGVIGVRASDGKCLWVYDGSVNNVANISTPVVDGDLVFSSTAYGAGAGLVRLAKDGEGVKAEEVYRIKANTFQNHHGGMVLVDGFLYAGHKQNGGDLVCIDFKTGKMAWGPVKAPGKGSAAVVCAGGHLVVRYQDGLVVLVEATPEACRIKGSFKPAHQERESWAHPVVSGGRLYLREQDKLMCYQL